MRFRKASVSLFLAALALGLVCLLPMAVAQEEFPRELSPEEVEAMGQAATGVGCACMAGMILFGVACVAVWIAILVYVYRDATARGMENAVIWLIVVFFTSIIGLIVYLIVRPPKPQP